MSFFDKIFKNYYLHNTTLILGIGLYNCIIISCNIINRNIIYNINKKIIEKNIYIENIKKKVENNELEIQNIKKIIKKIQSCILLNCDDKLSIKNIKDDTDTYIKNDNVIEDEIDDEIDDELYLYIHNIT